MGLSLSTSGGNQQASGAISLTITVPAGAAVGVLASTRAATFQGYLQGSVSDTGSNTYTAAGGVNSAGASACYSDSFYCLNTGSSASSVTYTPNAGLASITNIAIAVWVWTLSGGTATFGTQVSNAQSAPGTGTDAITSTAVTCATGSVVMGFTNDFGAGAVSVGTGFASDFTAFGILIAEHGAFSSNHAATWTTATGTDTPILSQGMSFGFSPSVPSFGPMPRQIYVMP